MRNILKTLNKSEVCLKKVSVHFRSVGLAFVLLVLSSITTSAIAQARVSLDFTNAPATEVFQEIKNQTQLSIVYNMSDLDLRKTVTIKVQNEEIGSALNKILSPLGLIYSMTDKHIVLAKKETIVAVSSNSKTITGIVVDKNNDPLIGVSVIVKGTTTGITTGVAGDYSLRVSDNDVLAFSYLGYVSKEVTVGNNSIINMTLLEDNKLLKEVVITALGIEREKKALTYNVQELKADAVLTVNEPSFVNSLAGKVAGVTINASSSGLGGSSKVVMRGSKSIAGNNNALYVIDGIPMPYLTTTQPSDLYTGQGQSGDGASNINPDDIESMSILTGPAAAALYGSEAANGVVLITTKKGDFNQDLTITYSNSTQFLSPFVTPRFQNTYGSEPGSFNSWGEKLAEPSTYNPMDFFQTGHNMSHALSLATGTAKNKTYVSAAIVNSAGIIPNNDFDRFNISFNNTSLMLNDKLKLDLNVMYMSVDEQNMIAQGQYFNPLIPIYLFPRGDDIRKYQTYERYDVERNFKLQYWPFGNMGLGMQNPYWTVNRGMFNNHKDRFLLGGGLKYDIMKGLSVSARVKMDYNKTTAENKFHASTDGIFAEKYGFYQIVHDQTRQVYADAMINYDKYFGYFSLSAILGASMSDVIYYYSRVRGHLNSVANLFSLQNMNPQVQTEQADYHDQLRGVFATAQLGYKSLVYLDVTARNDWSSSLIGTNTSSILYPSVGVSAILTDVFNIDSSVLSFLKARVSYSEVGNSPQRFIARPTYGLTQSSPGTFTIMPNSDLKPEQTKSWEAGLNMSLWNNKITLGASAYMSSTYNQLFNPALNISSGYASVYVNGGQVDNKGIELSLGLNQKLGPVDWNSTYTYSTNRNKIVKLDCKLPTGEVISQSGLDMGGTDGYKMKLYEGGSMGDFYVSSLQTDGHGYIVVDQSSQKVSIAANEFIYGGNVNPKHNMGLYNSFSWKGINLGFLITARLGGEVVSVTQAIMDFYGVSVESAEARDNDGALVNGHGRIPAQDFYEVIGGGTSGVGSMYVYSATNVRLAELSVGYNVPITNAVPFIKGLNVSFVGRNLFMFYNKAPFDPELTASTGTYYQGVDYFMAPSLRSLGFAVKLKF